MVSRRVTLSVLFFVTILILSWSNSYEYAFAQKLTKEQKKQCENLYFNYKKFGKTDFLKRYAFKSFINDCIKLYKDSKWTFKGKEQIDKYFDRLNKATKNVHDNNNSKDMPTTKITKKLKISQSKYMLNFQACIFSKDNSLPSFLVSSDLDKFIVTPIKKIPAKTCKNYWIDVSSKSPTNISIDFVENTTKYPNLNIKRI
jgi:hypothetical protein